MEHGPTDILFEALRQDDRLVQAEAARLLGELHLPAAVGPLLDYVRYSRWHAKTAGFHALAQIGDSSVCDAVRPLVNAPNCSDDWYWYGCKGVRAAAAVALLTLGDGSGEGYLAELAERDDDVFYAWFAPALLRLPDEPPAAARLKGRIAVERLAGDGARKSRSTAPGIVTMVCEALGVIGGPAACAKLLELMGFRSRCVRGQAAVSLLEAAPTEEHVAAVTRTAEDDAAEFARTKAALALATAGRAEYADNLRAAVERCEDGFDRAVAVQALGVVGRAQDLDLVASQTRDGDPYVRQCAVEALDRIGGEAAGRAVAPCREDPDIRVRMQAARFNAAREGGQQ